MKLEHEYIRVPMNHHRSHDRLMRLGALLIACLLIGIVSLGLYGGRPVPQPSNGSVVPVKCWEDEPCWDCETMGNQQCGPLDIRGDMTDDRTVYFTVDEMNKETP